MTARPLVVALLAVGFVFSSLGGCSCRLLLPSETIERSLAGPTIEDVAAGRGTVGDEVAWAGVLRDGDGSRWTFDAVDVPDEARVHGRVGYATPFVDSSRVAKNGRTFEIHDNDLGNSVQPGRAYVVYGVLASLEPSVLEIPSLGSPDRVLELRIREPLPALDRLGFVRGEWETRDESSAKWLPAVVFLPESERASEQAIASYTEAALGADASSKAVLGVEDSPTNWEGYRNVFDRMTRGAEVPFVVIDAKGSRRAEIAGLHDPAALRKAVELATQKAGER